MTESVHVFVNERRAEVDAGHSVEEALRALDTDLADKLRSGAAYITDGVGRKLDVSEEVSEGAIYRVVITARRG